MIDLMRSPGGRTFLWMWLGQTVSSFGTTVTGFALGVWIYRKTGEATPLALIYLFRLLPQSVLGPFGGVVVDRVNRKLAMLVGDAGQGIAVLSVLLLIAGGRTQLWVIYVLIAAGGVAGMVQWTAETAVVPLLVPQTQLARANGIQALGEGVGSVTAPTVAGVLVLAIGVSRVLLVDVATYVIAGLVLLPLAIPEPRPTGIGMPERRRVSGDLTEAWKYIAARPGLCGLLAVSAASNLVGMFVTWRLVTPLVLARAGSVVTLGVVGSAFDLGMIAGGVLMATWGGPRPRVRGLLLGLVLSGLFGQALFGIGQSLPVWGFAAFVGALLIPIQVGSSQAIWQANVDAPLQGRVQALRRAISQITAPVGLLAVGPLTDRVLAPAMRGPLGVALEPVFGVGRGRGFALTLLLFGAVTTGIGVAGFLVPSVRGVESEVPGAVGASAS